MSKASAAPDAPVPMPHRRVPQHLARRFAQISSSLLSEVSTPLGLMPWQFALVVQLRETPGMDRSWLAAAIGNDATSTGQALNQFGERGWVVQETNPNDRRASAYYLTQAGEELFHKVRAGSREVSRQLLAPLSETEAETLLDLLARLIDVLECHARPGAGRKPPRRRRPPK